MNLLSVASPKYNGPQEAHRMLVYFNKADQAHADGLDGRYLPYSYAAHDEAGGYYDFRNDPELIPEVLEDFRPYNDRQAVQTFYQLLKWVNGPTSIFESTDCLLRPASQCETGHGNGAALQITGRLMLIFRDHARNTQPDLMETFSRQLHTELASTDEGWMMGCIGYAKYYAHFTSLGTVPIEGTTTGNELCLGFWAWGNSEDECFDSLDRLFANLQTALERTSEVLKERFDASC